MVNGNCFFGNGLKASSCPFKRRKSAFTLPCAGRFFFGNRLRFPPVSLTVFNHGNQDNHIHHSSDSDLPVEIMGPVSRREFLWFRSASLFDRFEDLGDFTTRRNRP
jgi:hypothetical protein